MNLFRPPSVTNVSVPLMAGDLVTIMGVNFGTSSNNVSIKIADRSILFVDIRLRCLELTSPDITAIQVINDREIIFSIGPGTGAQYEVVITVTGQSSLPFPFFFAPPQIFLCTPSIINTTGASVTIEGLNFGTDSAAVMFGSYCILVTSIVHFYF